MKKILFVLLALGLITTPSFAWRGDHYYPRPRIIIRPNPYCYYKENILYFPDMRSATEWVRLNRTFVVNPEIRMTPDYVEVWYLELFCT